MLKKYKFLIIAGLALILAVGGYWYAAKNKDNGQNKIAFNTGFVLLDDEKNLVWNESINLGPEEKAQFETKIKEIKADLAAAADKERLLADYNNLAIYNKYLGNYGEAYRAYLESLKLENQARITWQNLGDVLLKAKAIKSAEMAFKKSVELNKYIPESYVKLADFYKEIGDKASVEAVYKLAVDTIKESKESDVLVLNEYAGWLADQQRYEEAVRLYEQLIIKQPGNKAAIEKKIENIKKNIQ